MSDPNVADDETEATLAELLAELPESLRDEADAAVAEARDADDLVERLADLRERRGVGGGTDGSVAEASSVADLRAELDAAGAEASDRESDSDVSGEAGAGDDAGGDAGDDDGVFGRVRSTLDGVRERVAGDAESTEGEEDAADVDADADSPARPVVERSRDVAENARFTSVPSFERDLSLPSVDRDGTRDAVRAARDRAGAGADELKRTLRDADPKQAALWGLATGVTVANPAIAASYSTAVLLSGAVLGGSAVGAYASSHDDTVFDDVDPMLMARRANAGASAGAGARNVNGKSVGAVLGASAYLAERLTPEAYAHWVAEADAESVLRGAEMGAGRAADSADFTSVRSGAALGGGLGLLYGLAADDDAADDDHALRELLDDDLWDEYAGRLGGDTSEGGAGATDAAGGAGARVPGEGARRVESRPAEGDAGADTDAGGDGDGDVHIPDAEAVAGDDADEEDADAADSEFEFGRDDAGGDDAA